MSNIQHRQQTVVALDEHADPKPHFVPTIRGGVAFSGQVRLVIANTPKDHQVCITPSFRRTNLSLWKGEPDSLA